MRSAISGSNIGNIYLFVGYYDASSSYIFVADTDFLESPDTQEAEGVYYPRWGDGSDFTVKFDWDPVLFTISDGNVTDVALFTPQSYGASAEEAIYTVEGTYTYAESGSTLSARLYFRNGELVSVYGITGDPFLVFATNAFALLGLRALYFLLEGSLQAVRYLPYGLAAILAFFFIGRPMIKAA